MLAALYAAVPYSQLYAVGRGPGFPDFLMWRRGGELTAPT
jgi:hypothetical protein